MPPGPRARTLQVANQAEEVNALFYERGWTDGLPIVPPTEAAAVEAMLRYTDRDPADVIGILPPRQGEATVERIAINAATAGCLPRYLPVVVAAVKAVSRPVTVPIASIQDLVRE